MAIYYVLRLLTVEIGQLGRPANILVPLCLAAGAAVQLLLLWLCKTRRRWLFLAAAGGIVLSMELLLHIVHSYTAVALIAVMAFALSAALGAGVGTALFYLVTGVRRMGGRG